MGRFSPKTMNLNSLESGLLIKRIPIRREGHIVSVKIEWPKCLAIIAIEDCATNDPVRSELHFFHLTSEECLFNFDLGQNLASVSHLFCKGHSNISITDDFLVISLIDEVKIKLLIWAQEAKKGVFRFESPHKLYTINRTEVMGLSSFLPPATLTPNCLNKFSTTVTLKQLKIFRQNCYSNLQALEGGCIESQSGCNHRIFITKS